MSMVSSGKATSPFLLTGEASSLRAKPLTVRRNAVTHGCVRGNVESAVLYSM